MAGRGPDEARNGGIPGVWKRLPATVRTLVVAAGLIGIGFSAATALFGLQTEREVYKSKVDGHDISIAANSRTLADMKPALRYLICATVQTEAARPTAGCEAATQGTEWMQVIRDARMGR